MRLSRIGAKPQRRLYRCVGERNTVRGWIEIEKEEQIVRARGITIRGDKVRVALNRFVKRFQGLEQCCSHVGRINIAVDDCLGLKIKLKRVQVLSRALFDLRLLLVAKAFALS